MASNSDGVSFSFDGSQFDAMTVDIKDPTDRATKYALRATGRYLAKVAKAKAPVYRGTSDPRAVAEKGNLRKSIANARSLSGTAGAYELKVGPFGTKKKGTLVVRTGPSRKEGGTSGQARGVPLYRSKMEAKFHYMEAGLAAAAPAMKGVYEDALAKAWAKWVS